MSDPLKTICVIGLGYVGLPLALLSARKGWNVIGIDINAERIGLLQAGKIPFQDELVLSWLSQAANITFTCDFQAVATADVIVICVPTPVHEDNRPDLGPVIQASQGIAPYLHPGQVVILESTVNPGISETVVQPLLEERGLRVGHDIYLAHCPERINPGDPRFNVENIARVLGASDEVGLDKAAEFYESILTAPVRRMGSLKEAEAVKVVENSFRDINIAFVNELAKSFSKLGIDVVNVIDGAATKPFAFMPHYPGCGVGGHCIPVDPYYLIEYAKSNGFHHDFLSLARRINSDMPAFAVEQLKSALNDNQMSLNGSRIAVLGVAYKADIGDYRESPAFEIIDHLKAQQAEVVVFDPYVPKFSSVPTLEDALTRADAVLITTAHKQFKNLTPEIFQRYNIKVIVDGRNCLDKQQYLESRLCYRGIGR